MNVAPLPPDPVAQIGQWLDDPALLVEIILNRLAAGGEMALVLVRIVFPAVIAALLVRIALSRRRRRRNSNGERLLRVLPPPVIEGDGALTLWMALHSLIRPRWRRWLIGQPHLAWEFSAQAGAAQLSVWIPGSVPPGLVERAIESAWPGTIVQEVSKSSEPIEVGHISACELALADGDHFPIGTGTLKDPLRPMLGALTLLDPGETSMVQVLMRPLTLGGRHRMRTIAKGLRRQRSSSTLSLTTNTYLTRTPVDPALDQDVKAILSKASAPLWGVVLRVMVSSPNKQASRGKIHALAGAFAVFEGRNTFRRKPLRGGSKAIDSRTMRRGFILSAPELASIATLPTADALPGLARAKARSVAPPTDLPHVGKTLGVSDHPASKMPVAISVADSAHHFHVIGETGTGKSTLIAKMVLEDADAGRAAVVIDPKGDLVETILGRLPDSAVGRTCLLDPDDPEVSVGLNVLEGDDPDLIVDHIVSVFKRIYDASWGPRTDDIMRAACLTLTQMPEATLAEVPLLLMNRDLRNVVRYRRDDFAGLGDLGSFWDWYEQLGESARNSNIAPLMNKLRAFLLRGPVRAMIGQSRPRLVVKDLIEANGLLLVRIPKGTLGEETSRILGAFVVARVWQACMNRASRPASRPPITLYVDEMHNYLAMPRSFEDLLAEARGYGLSLVLVHQHMGQLPRDMREALGANARTKIAFACSPEDAGVLEKHFAPHLAAHDLSNLAAFQGACRPCVDSGHGAAFTFRTAPLSSAVPARSIAVREASAERFAIARSDAEARIRLRHSRMLGHPAALSPARSGAQSPGHLRVAHPPGSKRPGNGHNG